MATEALEMEDEENKWKEVEEAMMRAKKGERLEVKRLASERQIEILKRMKAKRLEDEIQQEADLRQEDKLQLTKVETTE